MYSASQATVMEEEVKMGCVWEGGRACGGGAAGTMSLPVLIVVVVV